MRWTLPLMAAMSVALWVVTVWALAVSDMECGLWPVVLVVLLGNFVIDGWILLAEHHHSIRNRVALWTALTACAAVAMLVVFAFQCGCAPLRTVAVIHIIVEVGFATTVALRVDRAD